MLEVYIRKPGKYNGKEYKAGDKYPAFDPDNAADVRSLSVGFFYLKRVEEKKAPAAKGSSK